MIYIKKNSPPKKFVEFVQKNKHAHFDDMPSDIKQILRDSLLKEQGYLCAYCMSRIDNANTKIEHYVPRNNENELDYKNLLAVCEGKSFDNEKKHQHCDTQKGNRTLQIDPQNEFHISQISYKPDGTIYSKDGKFDDDLNLILNLNGIVPKKCEDKFEHNIKNKKQYNDKYNDVGYLKESRKRALQALTNKIDQINKKFKDKTVTFNFFKKALKRYTSLNEKGELQPFCGILIEYLEKKINKWHK